jgi:hypothetical protein
MHDHRVHLLDCVKPQTHACTHSAFFLSSFFVLQLSAVAAGRVMVWCLALFVDSDKWKSKR